MKLKDMDIINVLGVFLVLVVFSCFILAGIYSPSKEELYKREQIEFKKESEKKERYQKYCSSGNIKKEESKYYCCPSLEQKNSCIQSYKMLYDGKSEIKNHDLSKIIKDCNTCFIL